jgi:hypothetical protein
MEDHCPQHREERTIGGSELGSLDLAAQHVELVSENGDLGVFGVFAADAAEQHADRPARHEGEEGQSHWPIVPDPGPCCSAHAAEVSEPAEPWLAGRQDETLASRR